MSRWWTMMPLLMLERPARSICRRSAISGTILLHGARARQRSRWTRHPIAARLSELGPSLTIGLEIARPGVHCAGTGRGRAGEVRRDGRGDDRATKVRQRTPFYRLEQLEEQLGIPLPAATQWEIVEERAEVIKPARDELIRQAAQGEVLHNDDTGMKVLKMEREPGDKRTGMFTSGIVSTTQGRKIALYFTGRQHAGENIAEVLKQRSVELGPAIQMCDALSWNAPKLPGGVECWSRIVWLMEGDR